MHLKKSIKNKVRDMNTNGGKNLKHKHLKAEGKRRRQEVSCGLLPPSLLVRL